MPITKRDNGWYWGSQGPFDSEEKAEKSVLAQRLFELETVGGVMIGHNFVSR